MAKKQAAQVVKSIQDISYSADFKHRGSEYMALGYAMELEAGDFYAHAEISKAGKPSEILMRNRYYISPDEAESITDCVLVIIREVDKLITKFVERASRG